MSFELITDPISKATEWICDAELHGEIYPDAACLSTLRPDGYPDGRMVLVRRINESGFAFFTNSNSTKGQSLAQCPKASLTFHWKGLGRQLRVLGDVVLATEAEADDYFSGRFLISQIGAWASDQSRPIASREALMALVSEVTQRYEGQPVPRPPHWIGYRIVPIQIEFWIDGEFRLHDRHHYSRADNGWVYSRLNP